MARLSVVDSPSSNVQRLSIAPHSIHSNVPALAASPRNRSITSAQHSTHAYSSVSDSEDLIAPETPTRSRRTVRSKPYSPSKLSIRSNTRLHHERNSSARSTPRLNRPSLAQTRSRPYVGYVSSSATVTETEDNDERGDETEAVLPLVLLHVTLLSLPSELISREADDILADDVSTKVRLLHGKTAGEVGRRGLLVRHPGIDFHLLEERVLQGLGLTEGPLTPDGHLTRAVQDGDIREVGSEKTDSGFESCSDSGHGKRCSTCRCHIAGVDDGVAGNKDWTVKVFAANGLMTSTTWATAWQEMERVDVLVAPWIDEATQHKLSEAAASTRRTQKMDDRQGLEQHRVREHETTLRMAHLEELVNSLRNREHFASILSPGDRGHSVDPASHSMQSARFAKVPLDVLLRNYLFLLAKDTRNVVIAALLLLTTVLLIQLTAARQVMKASGLHSCEVLGQTIAESLASMRPVMAAASGLQGINDVPRSLMADASKQEYLAEVNESYPPQLEMVRFEELEDSMDLIDEYANSSREL